MKRKTIEIGDKPMELDPMCEIEVNEENPLDKKIKMYSSSAWM